MKRRARYLFLIVLVPIGTTATIIGAAAVIIGTAVTMSTLHAHEPVRLIFDTDMGNDVDDALALGVIHALQSRGECQLLAVTTTKDADLCAPFIDAVNTFYGRGNIPIGVVRNGPKPGAGKFLGLCKLTDDGKLRYPHDLTSGQNAPGATELLRQVLAEQPDSSVVIAQVGFSTNLARLLESPPDKYSPLSGTDLVKKKVQLLSAMAGAFQMVRGRVHHEYNVAVDIPSAQRVIHDWPTPVVLSGYEIGLAIKYPAASIENDFAYVPHHPLPEAYQLYEPTPHERPCWDLTSVLYAARPQRGYFGLSPRGRVRVDDKSATQFKAAQGGNCRYLKVSPDQIVRVREALAQLASQPPGNN